jgi:hypothetical protein
MNLRRLSWSRFFLAIVLPVALALWLAVAQSGCINPQFPKDAHLEKGSVKVNTPWGGYEMNVEQLDTGVAARNSTERPVRK